MKAPPDTRGGRRLGLAVAALALLLLHPPGCTPDGATSTGLPGLPAARAATVATPAPPPACRPNPLPGRDLFLRGSHNHWNSDEPHRFTWLCDRYELVARLHGEHQFKVGDDAWSRDADLGGRAAAPGAPPAADFSAGRGVPLVPVGIPFTRRFDGTYRFVLSMATDTPTLSISACDVPPLGDAQLFLRGTMNNWAALDDYAFQFSCDAYYLNVKLDGRFDFRIGETQWKEATSFGTPSATGGVEPLAQRPEPLGTGTGSGNLAFRFAGEQTLRLAFPGGKPMLTIGPKSFADPSAVAVDDPVALSLAHDSRALADKSPFGAVTAGTTVRFGVGAAAGVERLTLVVEERRLEGNQDVLEYTEVARVPMTRAADPARPGRDRWTASHRFDRIAVHGYWFEARIGGRDYVLHNNRHAVHWTRERGANGPAAVDEKPQATRTVRRIRLSVYDAGFRVPDYAPDIVYYYVFPERFRNGDPSNDPRPGRDTYQDKPVERHARWAEPPFRPGSGDGSDAVFNNDFFGGDLAGIVEKLDDIRELGANTLYLTPIFQASSNHKYDTADWTRIDPAFGTEADFVRLTREAERRGIRVILDTSLNHVGADSRYFDRFAKHDAKGAFEGGRIRPDSPYASWFSFDATQADPDRQFKGWVGINDLPELDKASPSFRRFAYGAPDSVMKRWLDRGAAGWRMDVAPWVPDDFWREWRAAIKAHRPDALTIAETWFDASKFFLGDMFDGTMNYIFRNAVLDYAGGGSGLDLVRQLEYVREVYPPPAQFALMNLTSSHDAARTRHVFGDHGPGTPPARVAEASRRQLLTVFLQMTHPGSPAVYYGDEVGVTGGEDPYNRATFPWPDQGGTPDLALRQEVRRLIAMRHAHPVLRRGELLAPLHVDANVVVFARRLGGSWAITAVNNADAERTVRVRLPAGAPAAWRDARSAVDASTTADGHLKLTVPAVAGRALLSR